MLCEAKKLINMSNMVALHGYDMLANMCMLAKLAKYGCSTYTAAPSSCLQPGMSYFDKAISTFMYDFSASVGDCVDDLINPLMSMHQVCPSAIMLAEVVNVCYPIVRGAVESL